MRPWLMSPSRRRSTWIVVVAFAIAAIVIVVLLAMSTPGRPKHRAQGVVSGRSVTPSVGRLSDSPRVSHSSTQAPTVASLPSTDDPAVYATAVASRLFNVNPADISRSEFIAFWRQNLPTVVYSDGAAKGLTLAEQNADAIDNLTHGWIPSEPTWHAEAADAMLGKLRITSISVPGYWVNAVASGEFTDPGLHMERVTGVLTETYGLSQRYTGTRAIVIDLGLLCGPTQPGGCRLVSPQKPPGQDEDS